MKLKLTRCLSSLIFLLFFSVSDIFGDDGTIINTKLGAIRGHKVDSRSNKAYLAFTGIPYAAPAKRFEESQVYDIPWDGVYGAEETKLACPQDSRIERKKIDYNEDCLFLNIYTPVEKNSVPLPTMVWLHGGFGAFASGNGNDYSPDYFLDHQVILVTLNYRLGALGFMTTNDERLPGNLGLKDQMTALKWLREHITEFGGDKEQITLFGQGFGAALVSYHLASDMSKGLFSSAIIQSGSALSPWALPRQDYLEVTEKFASNLGCSLEEESLKNCLQQKPLEEILEESRKLAFSSPRDIFDRKFGPIVETTGDSRFITEEPAKKFETGRFNQVPVLIGFNEDEGSLLTALIFQDEVLSDMLDEKWESEVAEWLLLLGRDSSTANVTGATKAITDFYIGHGSIGDFSWDGVKELLTDRLVGVGVAEQAKFLGRHATVNAYIISYAGDKSIVNRLLNIEGDFGVTHFDELQYLFPGSYDSSKTNKDEGPHSNYIFSKNLVNVWANFARDRKPSLRSWANKEQDWRPISPLQEDMNWAVLDFDVGESKLGWFSRRLKFWENIEFHIKNLKDDADPSEFEKSMFDLHSEL